MATLKMTVVWQDVAGQTTLRTLTTQTGASALMTALLAKSNAAITEFWEGGLSTTVSTPVAASFPLATAVAYLRFTDGTGEIARIALPAPLASIFMGDGLSVDPTQIPAIIAAALGNVQTASGTLVTAFDSGYLSTGGTQ